MSNVLIMVALRSNEQAIMFYSWFIIYLFYIYYLFFTYSNLWGQRTLSCATFARMLECDVIL